MLKKLCLSILIVNIVFLFLNDGSFAQSPTPGDVVVGGKAKCVITGRSPFKKFIADGNRLLILQSEGISQGSFSLQSTFQTKKEIVDLNTLALFGLIPNVDEFLAGKLLPFQNSNSDLEVKITENDGSVVEVFNKDRNKNRTALKGKIKITKSQDSLVNGTLKYIFQNVFFKDPKNENKDEVESLGRIIVNCKFTDVPIAIKPLVSVRH